MAQNDHKEISNTQMHPAPTEKPPKGGEMERPVLADDILPIYLTKVFPESAEAAHKAAAAAVAQAPLPVASVANIDEPPAPPAEPAPAPAHAPAATAHK
jgi:hypothetical protein